MNPWRTHSRFLISHNLLMIRANADPLREWLGGMLPGSLLILDEPTMLRRRAVAVTGLGTKFTRAVRDLCGASNTGCSLGDSAQCHSNSFSTLLELLYPYRFTRGVKIRGKAISKK